MAFPWISSLRQRFNRRSPTDPATSALRAPVVKRSWLHTSLQFTATEAQSRMWTFRPQALLIGYTRSMMGFVRFVGHPERIAMIGLGGGSLAKYCHRHLPTAVIDVVEINPQVIALRDTFRVPKDDARFRVFLDDGALFLRRHRRRYDVLLVDGYDETGIPAPLASQRFYNDCHAALVEGGVLVVNLFCADVDRHLQRIRKRFGAAMVSVPQPKSSNQVVFAWVPGPRDRQGDNALSKQAQADLAAELARLDQAVSQLRGRNQRALP
ncbi:MAG: fused MFS/spermidine synthase [Pseudomarimonas sp.]